MGCAHTVPTQRSTHKFSAKSDSFAFQNDTVWEYEEGKVAAKSSKPADPKKYSRRCFVMSRAVVQFWKFAKFDPSSPALNKLKLKERVRELCRIDVWREEYPLQERIVFPGYANLHDLSQAEEGVLKENIGLDWPIYFRFGNTKMLMSPSAEQERSINDDLQQWLQENQLAIVWVYRFPEMDINHCVVIYDCVKGHEGGYHYFAYDPNSPGQSIKIDFDPTTNVFSFPPTFYFSGGAVSLRQVYLNPFE